MKIAVDFDGTCVTWNFPEVGEDIGAVPVLRRLTQNGHLLILNTMRGTEGEFKDTLGIAVDWFSENDIDLFGINKDPDQYFYTNSPKVYAHMYIDDSALGVPLKVSDMSNKPYVDWKEVEALLERRGLFDNMEYREKARQENFRDDKGIYQMVWCPNCGRENTSENAPTSSCRWCGCRERIKYGDEYLR